MTPISILSGLAAAERAGLSLLPLKVGTTESFLSEIEDKFSGLGTTVLDIIAIVIGITAAVFLIMIFIQSNRQQGQSKDSLVGWFVVLIVCLVAIELIRAFVFM